MDAPSTLSLSLLRQVLNRLLDDVVERSGGDEVELTDDHYWVLDSAELSLGQLSDDVIELRSAAAPGHRTVVWHDLSHAIGILQWLASRDRS